MKFKFALKKGKAGRLASLTVAMEDGDIEHGVTAEIERQLESRLQAECARRSLASPGKSHTDIQDNWVTGGIDVIATALVQARNGARKQRHTVRMRAAKVRRAS
jgi:hypothetical protein